MSFVCSPVKDDHPVDESLCDSHQASYDHEAPKKSAVSDCSAVSNTSSGKYYDVHPDQADLSEDEVTMLVRKALQRAREATTTGSNLQESSTLDEEKGAQAEVSPTHGADPSRDVIKKVEEEITNAKKAAVEAQKCISQVLSVKSSSTWEVDEPQLSESKELATLLDGDVETDSVETGMQEILNVANVEALTDDGEPDVSLTETARDLIHEEFGFLSHDTNNKGEDPLAAAGSKEEQDDIPDIDLFLGNVDETVAEVHLGDLNNEVADVGIKKVQGPENPQKEERKEEQAQAYDPCGNGGDSTGPVETDQENFENPWSVSPQVSEDEEHAENLEPSCCSSQPPSQMDEARDNVESTKRECDGDSHPRQVHFKEPYPPPAPLPSPRPSDDIIHNNETRVSESSVEWTTPKPQLYELIVAAKGDSLSRRANALGALKVLSLKKKNQLTLARTKGLLEALVSAVNASFGPDSMELGIVARARGVVSLLHLSEPKHNREILMAHPGLCASLVRIVEEDDGEARAHACGALAMLAKTASNREPMVLTKNLVSMLASVVKLQQKDDKVNDEASDDGSEAPDSSDDDSSFRTASSYSESSTKPHDDFSFDRTYKKPSSYKKQKDGQKDEFANCARYNACAALAHLSKQCICASILNQNDSFLEAMMITATEFQTKIHTKCVEVLCNLTRFPANNASLAQSSELVETFVQCGKSKLPDDRLWALRAFQNISSDSAGKLVLATNPILTLLCTCAVQADHTQQVAAVAALYNISTDPDAVVPITNTRNVVATLVHLAHNSESSDDVRQMSCDALATIGLWLQKLASSGTTPEGLEKVPLPSHTTSGWERWD